MASQDHSILCIVCCWGDLSKLTVLLIVEKFCLICVPCVYPGHFPSFVLWMSFLFHRKSMVVLNPTQYNPLQILGILFLLFVSHTYDTENEGRSSTSGLFVRFS